MGEFTQNYVQGEKLAADTAVSTPPEGVEKQDGVATDVEGIFADGEKGGIPVFDVDKEDFLNNMKADRRRMRFKTDSKVAQYHRNTKYRRPFWVRDKENGYTYKVK